MKRRTKTAARAAGIAGATLFVALSSGASFGQETDPGERLDAIASEAKTTLDQWMADVRKKMAAAQDSGEEPDPAWFTPPIAPYMKRARAAAEEYAGTPEAIDFLLWMSRTYSEFGGLEDGRWAFETLLDEHADSDDLFEVQNSFPQLTMLGFDAERVDELLAKVEASNPDDDTRAWATYTRSLMTVESADVGSDAYETAKTKLLAAAETIGDTWIVQSADAKVRVREQFSLGMSAPDIVGDDLDGQEFRLTDYKGKVLFVDFWGDW